MKKIKFLFLALLGITIIPSAYAVPLDFSIYGHTTEFNDSAVDSTLCNIGNLPVYGFLGCSYNAGNTPHANFVKSLYSRFFFTYKTSIPSYVTIDGVHVRDIGETREFRWSYFTDDGKQGHSSLVIPSRTAYQYTISGKKNIFTEVFFYPYQFTFYDPQTRNSLTYVGKNKLVNGILLANPGVQTDNVWLISLSSRKAWSITMDEQSARDVLLGRGITESYLKTLQFTKSYAVRDGGKQIAPETWRNSAHNEGTGFIYTPDAEFVAPKWSIPPDENTPIQKYNQCLAYYNSIKTYATYDRECYKDLLDSAPLTGSYDMQVLLASRQAIDEWNGEGEGPATDNRICNLRKGYKKSYKIKFQKKREEFLQIAKENWFSPLGIDIKTYCGERPKIEENKGFFDSVKDFFSGKTGDPIWIDDNGKKYYASDFADDWENLRSLYWKCQGLDKRGIMKSLKITDEEKQKACSDYQIQKSKFLKKWEHATIPKFYGGGLPAAIWEIEKGGVGGSGFIEKLKKDISDSSIGDSLSYVGDELFGRIKGPFYSGYNSVLSLNCATSSIPHIEIMDYIAMGAFALMAFILFKLL